MQSKFSYSVHGLHNNFMFLAFTQTGSTILKVTDIKTRQYVSI